MLNASVDVQRVFERLRRPRTTEPLARPTVDPIKVRSRSAARQVRDGLGDAAASTRFLPSTRRRRPGVALALPSVPFRRVVTHLGHERTVAIAVAGIVLGASFLSVGTARPSRRHRRPHRRRPLDPDRAGGRLRRGRHHRLGRSGLWRGRPGARPEAEATAATGPNVSALSRIVAIDTEDPEAAAAIAARDAEVTNVEGPFLADGTLLKPVAVDTQVADGSDLVKTYKVKAGDTLSGIAHKHGVKMMTLWWANKLESKDDLHRGQVLRIPPVNGLVVEVKAGQTIADLATAHKVTTARIIETNGLTDENLVVGQVLVLPGAKGEPIPTPKPTKKPTSKANGSSRSSGGGGGGGGSARPPKTYSGGNFAWPAPGGHVSQYYHYGHYGLDIDGSSGDRIVAAAGGTVTFAGWKSNGGGYQVWIAHGSGLYTTYNHMSSVSVGRGQHVSKGQKIGRMGATGFASGSHLHFEVWRGPIWNGGRRVNPLAYL